MLGAVAQRDGKSGRDTLVGESIGGYRIEERIGSGATGVVYRARDREDGGAVAIKVLADDLGQIPSLERRFQREARALAKLRHRRVVHISDFGVDKRGTFIVMELLEGQTLEESLSTRPIEPQLALGLMRQVLDGVACAHAEQVVHRDLKPANVFLLHSAEDEIDAKVLDFGLAKFLSVDELSQDVTLTRRGRIVGTPAYMAPEQITGVSLDVRADVYALGVLLFEMLADRRPFDYARRSELLRAHLFEEPPWLADTRPGLVVHPDLERFVRRALAKNPDERFADGREMQEALASIEDDTVFFTGLPPRAMPRSKAGTNSVLISAEERAHVTAGYEDAPRVVTTESEKPSPPGTPPSVELYLGSREANLTESEVAAVALDEAEDEAQEIDELEERSRLDASQATADSQANVEDATESDLAYPTEVQAMANAAAEQRSTWRPQARPKRSPATIALAIVFLALAVITTALALR